MDFNSGGGGTYLQAKSRMYNRELSSTRKFPTKKRREKGSVLNTFGQDSSAL